MLQKRRQSVNPRLPASHPDKGSPECSPFKQPVAGGGFTSFGHLRVVNDQKTMLVNIKNTKVKTMQRE